MNAVRGTTLLCKTTNLEMKVSGLCLGKLISKLVKLAYKYFWIICAFDNNISTYKPK